MIRHRSRLALVLVAGLALGTLPATRTARADDVVAEPIPPALVLTFAGMQRVLDDVDFIMGAAERPEIAENFRSLLENANGLGGLDRDKPFGFALYLKPGLVPLPVPVGFVPVDRIEDLLETVALGPVVTRKMSDGRYEVIGPFQSLFIDVRDGYGLIYNDELNLELDIIPPMSTADVLSKKYVVSLAVYVENVPKLTRDFFLQLLKTSANAELQQRDDEPDGIYALRKANGKRTFEGLEMFLTDVERVVVGWDTSIENKQAVLDIDIDIAPDTKMAALLDESVGKTSLFSPVVDELSPLAVSGSWIADEPGRDTLVELFNVADIQLSKLLNPDREPTQDPLTGKITPVRDPTVARLIAPLVQTARAGHMDFFFQFQAEDADSMVLVGGARLLNAEEFGAALLPIIQRLDEVQGVDLERVETSVDSHQGIAIHMLKGNNANPGEVRLYGTEPAFYFGAGKRAVWFAIGGDNATSQLKAAIDGVVEATIDEKTDDAPPFRMVLNAKSWMKIATPPEEAPESVRTGFAEAYERAFSPGGDAIHVESRPTESGMRTRVVIEEGFIRLMGIGIAAGADIGEAREKARRERRGEREGGERPARDERPE